MVKPLQETNYGDLLELGERRLWPRFRFLLAVEAIDIQANIRIAGRLSDIAKKGCYIETIHPFAEKASVALTVTRGQQSFKTQATVVHSQIGKGMGLLFTTAEPAQLRVLETWLDELAREGVKPTR